MKLHLAVLLSASPEHVGALLDRAAGEGRVEADVEVRRRDGTTFPAHVTIAPLRDEHENMPEYAVVIRDLSEQVQAEENLRRSEEQLRHSQKMDAIGRLASGIAHDFNNVLTAIQGHVQFLLEDLPADLASRDDAEEIRKAADRATELTRQLLTFARKQPSQPVSLNPNALITDIEKLLRRLIRADVTLDTALEDVPNVLIDPGQLEQVIVNLVVNARDAIGSAGGITITTSTMTLDEIYSARGLNLTPGEYVNISVSDTGMGMSVETQLQIFEPFFTTKSEGTGLGLSTVYGIVKQAGGHVSVYSEPGRGTTFKVFLPVQDDHVRPVENVHAGARNETGTVLLVEDDEAVRALARRTLEGKGYAVVEAADGEEALRIATGHNAIDVVITDLTMPRLGGEELAARIRETRPDAGIVLMSGFSEVSLLREGRIREHGHFLEKPFTPNALVDVVREAMLNDDDQSSTKST
jgi:signal transduction histidine kinase/CheY-like chemotaxis protein